MRLLLDTHAFVWAVADSGKLSKGASEAIRSADSELFLSSAVAWELATKYRIGKFPQAESIIEQYGLLAEDLVARHLPITPEHALRAGAMPVDHRDPFDRVLAAQAQIEGLQLITLDPAFGQFDVKVVW